MSNLVDINGAPIPTQDQKAQAEAVGGLINTILPLMKAQNADLNVMSSVAINLILHVFHSLPTEAEKSYINQTMQILAQAFGQATVVKNNVAAEARKAANQALQIMNEKKH